MAPKTTKSKKKVAKTTPKATTSAPETTTSAPKTTAETTTSAPKTTAETTTSAPKTIPKTPAETTTSAPKTTPSASKTTPRAITTRKTTASRKTTSPSPTPETTLQTTTPPKTTSPKTPSPQTSPVTTPAATKTASSETVISPKTASPEPAAISPKTTPSAKNASPETSNIPKTTPLETAATVSQATSDTATVPQTAASGCKESAPDKTETAKTAPKTTTKIKKKIVKRKIITRRVKVKKEEKPQLPVEDEKPNPNPNQAIKITNPSSDPSEAVQMDSETLDSENPNAEDDEERKGEEEENEDEKGRGEDNENEKGGEIEKEGEEKEARDRSSERQQRRKTEIFIGGLDKDAKEDDIRKVFGKVGQVVEIRLMKNSQTGKNKGYAFLRYASASDAKRATTEFAKVEVCGKQCAAVAAEVNDTIFLGNIDREWKKEDVMKLLQEIGIENIDRVTVIADHNNPDCNRGFAFIDLETNKDAQIAFKKLQKKDVFGKNRNIKVSWAEPLYEPDEEEMLKVKSVYVEGIPFWDEEKVRKHFEKFGEIKRVALSCNMQSTRRKDFAIVNFKTRESAISCIESFKTEELIDEGSKLNVKVSLAKPIPKNKGGSKSVQDSSKEKLNAVNRAAQAKVPFNKGKSVAYPVNSVADNKSSTTHELVQVLREQAAWSQGYMGLARGSAYQDHAYALHGGKRPFAALGNDMIYSDPRGYPRARLDSSFPVANSSYSTLPHGMSGTPLPYYQQLGTGYTAGMPYGYGTASRSGEPQMRQGAAPYGNDYYRRS